MQEPVLPNKFKWCRCCYALLRDAAKFCRLCRTDLTNPAVVPFTGTINLDDLREPPTKGGKRAKPSRSSLAHVSSISSARHWLPFFDDMTAALPKDALRLLLESCAADEPDELKYAPAIDVMIGYQLRPEQATIDLIWRVIAGLNVTTTLPRFVTHKRMSLIGISPELAVSENQLREQERTSAFICPICAEFNLKNQTQCRFCKASLPDGRFDREATDPPDIDQAYYSELLVFLAAVAKLDGNSNSLLEEALVSNRIRTEEIALRAKHLAKERHSYEEEVPLTSWECALISAGEPHKRTQYGVIQSMIQLSRSLRLERRTREAELIVRAAYALTRSKQTDEFVEPFIVDDCAKELRFHSNPLRPHLELVPPAPPPRNETAAPPPAENPDTARTPSIDELAAEPIAAVENLLDALDQISSVPPWMKDAVRDAVTDMSSQSSTAWAERIEKWQNIMQSMRPEIGSVLPFRNEQSKEDLYERISKSLGHGKPPRKPNAENEGELADNRQSDSTLVCYQCAISQTGLAELYLSKGRRDKAIELLRQAERNLAQVSHIDDYNLSLIYRRIAVTSELALPSIETKGYYEAAIKHAERAIVSLRTGFPDAPLQDELADLLMSFAALLRRLGMPDEAQAAQMRAKRIRNN